MKCTNKRKSDKKKVILLFIRAVPTIVYKL